MFETVSDAFRSDDNSPFARHLTLRNLLCLFFIDAIIPPDRRFFNRCGDFYFNC